MPRKSKLNNEDALRKAFEKSTTYGKVLTSMGLSKSSNNYSTLHYYIKKYNIDVSHLQSNKERYAGILKYNNSRKIPLKDIIENNKHPLYNTGNLKQRLIKEGIILNKCAICGIPPTWNDKPLVLQLDHIDGVKTNHRLSNLQLLCPNCHTQTKTFAGRNSKTKTTKKHKQRDIYIHERNEKYINKQKQYIDKVLNSNIDFSKYGWVTKVASIINRNPQNVRRWMKKMMPEFLENKCYKREYR